MQLAKQMAELRAAQREGWVPPLSGLGALLPCFVTAASEGEATRSAAGTLSTATSGLSTMDTDDGSGELAAAAAAALASQEERDAAVTAAEAARQARREARRAEKERRRHELLREKREAKLRARAEAQRRYADQQQRWEAAVADKRQQVEDLQRQVCLRGWADGAREACLGGSLAATCIVASRRSDRVALACPPWLHCAQAAEAGERVKVSEEQARGLEERKHALFLQLKRALEAEQAEKQRKQHLAAMEEGEVATSPPAPARRTGAGAPPAVAAAAPAGIAAVAAAAPTTSGGGLRSPTFGQYGGGSFGGPAGGFGPLGGPSRGPGEPPSGYGSGGGFGGAFYGGRGGPSPAAAAPPALLDAARSRDEFGFEDGRSRDAWGAGAGAGGSAASTPRGPREGLPAGFGGGGTPAAGERERGDFSWPPRDFRGGPGGPGGRGGWRGSFDERRCGGRVWVAGWLGGWWVNQLVCEAIRMDSTPSCCSLPLSPPLHTNPAPQAAATRLPSRLPSRRHQRQPGRPASRLWRPRRPAAAARVWPRPAGWARRASRGAPPPHV